MNELPIQFTEKMKNLLGADFDKYLESFQQKRVYGLRVNTDKISVEDFLKISPFRLEPIPWCHNGFYYDEKDKVSKHPYYFAGLYYLQEPSAMLPAEALPVLPDDIILDTCAAPGGKSTALGNKLGPNGLLVSNDISNSRAQALLKNLELFGISNLAILSEDLNKMVGRYDGFFDKILIDAPCSGEGMFRKEPAVIKSWIEHGNDFYVSLQKSITANALRLLKKGGMLLYSTCTFDLSEDEEMILYMKSICPELKVIQMPVDFDGFVHGFVEKASINDSELDHCRRLFPYKIQGEGHFVTLLQKGESDDESSCYIPAVKDCKLPEEAAEFFKNVKLPKEHRHFEIRNELLYLVPDCLPDLSRLRVMRAGLLLGECKKNRFEPSQALAMSLKESDYPNCISFELNDERVIKYLKGETLDVTDINSSIEGWVLVCVNHFPLGFAKAKSGVLKNKYLPGWRYQ